MTINYVTTSKDYLSLLNEILSRSVLGKNFSKYAWVAISCLAWMSVILPYLKYQDFGIGFWLRASFALLITIGWPYFYEKYNNGVFSGIINDQTLKGFAGKVSITLSDDFIEAVTQTTTSKALWKDIHSVQIDDNHIFIFFTPLIATPIPLGAFKTSTEENEFLKKVESHIPITNIKSR